MKQSWKIRLIFIIACITVILYLSDKRDELTLGVEQVKVEYSLVINEVMIDNRNSKRDEEGDFEDWIEIYNHGDTAVSLQGFGLSNDSKQPFLWILPDKVIQPKSFCIVWASEKNRTVSDAPLHTNFKLKNKDKVILLTAPNNSWHDIFVLESMEENISYGRVPDGGPELYGFDEGTPGKANKGKILVDGPGTMRLNGPEFSCSSGFYTQAFDLTLITNDADAEIYYTLDGSVPNEESAHYTGPIAISPKVNEANVVRARTYKEGYPKSEIITRTYFVEQDIFNAYNTPVISLVTDPKNLFDYEDGIYVGGKILDQWKAMNPEGEINQTTPANYTQKGKDWEREASMELFETNGAAGLSQNIGIRTHGGYSRANSLKSLSLFARMDYNDSEYFTYDFFDGKAKNYFSNRGISLFSHIVLRTSATDSKYALFRDDFIQSLVKTPIKLDLQASKTCILYINGKYYGIHNIREAYDKIYVSKHYDMKEEDVVIIKNPTGIAGVEIEEGYAGDEMYYNRVIAFVKEKDLHESSNYNFIKTQIDVDNFIDYNILEIYCDNRDWPGNNVRIWRKRVAKFEAEAPYGHDGRWRWMVFDLDYGFGLYQGAKAAQNNSLERATAEDGPIWPNPPWSTLLLRSLLKNDEFRYQFINQFADRLNTIFLPETVVNRVMEIQEVYFPNVSNHINRWNLHDNKVENWLAEVEGIRGFAKERPEYMRQHIVEYFALSGTAEVQVEMNEGGIVKVNSLEIDHRDKPWIGIYFKDVPITIEAIPKSGYAFAGWEGMPKSQENKITISLSQALHLKAIFESL